MMGILAFAGAALLKAVLPGLATLLGGYVVALVRKLSKKAHVDLTEAQQSQLAALVERAVLAVEERSHRETMTSDEKAKTALDIVATADPAVSRQLATDTIDATLARLRKIGPTALTARTH